MALSNDDIFKNGTMLFAGNVLKKSMDQDFKINSKSYFENQGAIMQQSELATELPEIKVSKNQKEVDNFLKQNEFLSIIQKLENYLFKKGLFALGVRNGKKIILAKVVDYGFNDDNELEYLKVNVGDIQNDSESFSIYEEYSLNKNKGYVNQIAVSRNGEEKPLKEILGKAYKQKIFAGEFIPFTIFKNNAQAKAEVDLIDQQYFDLLDVKLKALYYDTFTSTPTPLINWDMGNNKVEDIKSSLYSLGKQRMIETHSIGSFTDQMARPFEIVQGQSNSITLIQSIESISYWIKQALLFKKDSSDGGVHNMHSTEAQQLNSSYNHNMEMKANLREIYYEKFIRVVLKCLGLDSQQEIEVIAPSSSKYLDKQARVLSTDQNGVLLNNNLVQSQPQEQTPVEE
ncbi:hypothetical protein [Mycoplasma seminis]|uniref:Phage portal protein n=1 Tax=Mycoplasma seminis TaxID=512749 RepID=A0ABY9H9H3_9MOLU|nr:hypothetical protein [Mycoplasma seminis]WLP85239.1 hypothetical protein Q8852_02865 [Mycoplasma seminis]